MDNTMDNNSDETQSQADIADISTRQRAERTFYRFLTQTYDAFSSRMGVEADNLLTKTNYKVPSLLGVCQVAYPEKYKLFAESPMGLYIFFFLKDSVTLTLQVGHKESDGSEQSLGDTPTLTAEEVIGEIEKMILMSIEEA